MVRRTWLLALENALAQQHDARVQVRLFGRFLEALLTARFNVPWQASRAARVATALFEAPGSGLADLANTEAVSRRQLEQDFGRWLGTSPKQASLIANEQATARLGWKGMPIMEIAHELGFADQSHMNRVVKKMSGLTPPDLAR